MVYKGCERPHWRDPMPGKKTICNFLKKEETYYHQIFFHYVLQDGQRAHCAWNGHCPHSDSKYSGYNKYDSRLFHMFFFDTE